MATGGEVGGQILDSVAQSEDLSELKCQPCQEDGIVREAVGICTDCQDYLCRECFDIHTKPKPMRNHQLLDKQEMLQSHIKFERKDKCTKKCSLHDDKKIKYFCIEHNVLCCSVCMNLDHRTCTPVHYIPLAVNDLDHNAEFTQAETYLSLALALCSEIDRMEKERIGMIEERCVKALGRLETHRKKVNDTLDEMQAEIVKNAETMKAAAIDKITNITDKFRETQRELMEFQTSTAQLQKRHQNCDLYISMMHMQDRLRVFEDEMEELKRKLPLGASDAFFYTPDPKDDWNNKCLDFFGSLTKHKPGARSRFRQTRRQRHTLDLQCLKQTLEKGRPDVSLGENKTEQAKAPPPQTDSIRPTDGDPTDSTTQVTDGIVNELHESGSSTPSTPSASPRSTRKTNGSSEPTTEKRSNSITRSPPFQRLSDRRKYEKRPGFSSSGEYHDETRNGD